MKSFVDLQGAGETVTTLTGLGGAPAVLVTANQSGIRDLTVSCSANARCIAVQNDAATSPSLSRVTATAAGKPTGEPSLALNSEGGSLVCDDCTLVASGENVWGLALSGSGQPTFSNFFVRVTATGTATAFGVKIADSPARLRNGLIDVATDQGAADGIVVDIPDTNVVSTQTFASIDGVDIRTGTNAQTGATALTVFSDESPALVEVRDARLIGDAAFDTNVGAGFVTVQIADSELFGTVHAGTNAMEIVRVGDYDPLFTPLDATCQSP